MSRFAGKTSLFKRFFLRAFKNPFLCFSLFLFLGIIFYSVFYADRASCFRAADNLDKITQGCFSESRVFITPKELEKESPELCLIQKSSLAAVSPPILVTSQVLGALMGGSGLEEEKQKEIIEYIVESGDSLSSIAAKFDISLDTIFWANDLNKNSVIKPGQKLIILPVSGVVHYVEKNDTLGEIAKTYKAETKDIIAFNGLPEEGKIFIGDILLIPGGAMPIKKAPVLNKIPLASSYFICPILPPCRVSQGLHWYNAVDLGHEGVSCGEPIFAVAEGAVQKTGYTSLGGNFIRILHLNGVVTYYGHLKDILVKPGQSVSQGDIIGHMGYTGYTVPAGPAGCHLHFDVRGAENPFAK